jgi:hypothetical protein
VTCRFADEGWWICTLTHAQMERMAPPSMGIIAPVM